MKIILITLSLLFTIPSIAQEPSSPQKDSLAGDAEMKIIQNIPEARTKTSSLTILGDTSNNHYDHNQFELTVLGKHVYRKGKDHRSRHSAFEGHWTGFNYGFINFAKNDYSMYTPESGEFMEPDWAHSFAMQFNIFDHNISLSRRNNFGMTIGLGFEYQRLRFANNNGSIIPENGMVRPLNLDGLNAKDIKRSTLKVLYLTIPLLMEVQFPASHQKKLYFSGGVMGGIRMHSKTKIVYRDSQDDKQKRKDRDDFYLLPFKADVVARIGYHRLNVWGSYTLTNMFKSGKGPGLHAYTVGLGITI